MTVASLVIGSVVLEYDLVFEDRKTVAITVYPDQSIRVKAPINAEGERIRGILTRRARWIMRQRQYFAQFASRREKDYVSGESFRYLGRHYKLSVRETPVKERVILQHGMMVAHVRERSDPARVKRLLDSWFRERARVVFGGLLSASCLACGLERKPGLVVRPMLRRWGSYSSRTNRVTLNSELIRASTKQIQYVIIHELCHVTHMNHGRAFYDLLESRCPDWRRIKLRLEQDLLGR